jgi:hypothetical protein
MNKMKVLHGTWSCSRNQITKSTIKIFFTTSIKVLQIDVGFKNDVFMCYEGVAIFFENSKYVKPPKEGIACYAQRMICNVTGVLQTKHIYPRNMELQFNLGTFDGCCI